MKTLEDYIQDLKQEFEEETRVNKNDLGYGSKYIEWLEKQLYHIEIL